MIIGVLALMASCVPLGKSALQLTAERPRTALPAVAEDRFLAEHVQLDRDRSARLAFDITIETKSVSAVDGDNGASYRARYRVPFSYSVHGASGELLLEQTAELDWLGEAADDSGPRRQQFHDE